MPPAQNIASKTDHIYTVTFRRVPYLHQIPDKFIVALIAHVLIGFRLAKHTLFSIGLGLFSFIWLLIRLLGNPLPRGLCWLRLFRSASAIRNNRLFLGKSLELVLVRCEPVGNLGAQAVPDFLQDCRFVAAPREVEGERRPPLQDRSTSGERRLKRNGFSGLRVPSVVRR